MCASDVAIAELKVLCTRYGYVEIIGWLSELVDTQSKGNDKWREVSYDLDHAAYELRKIFP
jgi:hypothetical protein